MSIGPDPQPSLDPHAGDVPSIVRRGFPPRTMQVPPGGVVLPRDPEHDRRCAMVLVLPTDYQDYGGTIERWADDRLAYPDCSGGCIHFRPLFTEQSPFFDFDWGVCASPTSPRAGLLTFEHQAGVGCYEAPADELAADPGEASKEEAKDPASDEAADAEIQMATHGAPISPGSLERAPRSAAALEGVPTREARP